MDNKQSATRTLIATYGTLRTGNGNKRAITQHGKEAYEELGLTKIKGWELYSLGGFPGASPSVNKEMVVELYRVNDDVLRSVRSLEGYNPNKPHSEQYFYDEVEVETDFGTAKMYQYVNGGNGCEKIESGDWNEFRGI